MILIDANLLLYAYDSTSPHHAGAKQWFDEALAGEEKIGLPLQSLLTFLRVSTNAGLRGFHQSIRTVLATVDDLLALPHVSLVLPGPSHWDEFKRAGIAANVSGNLVTDAHLAALAMELDATLYSTDRDFTRFPGLRWVNPLARV